MLRRWILFFLLPFSLFVYAEKIDLPAHFIYFKGQQYFDESDLQEALGVETRSFFQFWKDRRPRIKDKLLPTLETSIRSFYRSEGFYDAEFNIEETNTTLNVAIKENRPVVVKEINVSSDYNISELITLKKSEIFRAKEFIQVKSNIIAQLLKDGYCSYDLDTKAYVDLDKHTVDLRYLLKKGEICTFGKLKTSGLETIDEDVVISRLRAKEGEHFSTELVQQTSNNLYALNAFDSVLINVDKKFYNVVPVEIQFKEMEKPYRIEAGAGYDTYVGARVHAEFTKYNFLGNAQKIQLKTAWSQKEQIFIIDFFKPALFNLYGYYIDLGTEGGYSNLEFEGFQEEKFFVKGFLEYTAQKTKLRAGIALENIDIVALDNLGEGEALEQAVNEGTFNLLYPYISFVYDDRDSKLNPKSGYYLSAYAEVGLSSGDDASIYLKTLYEGRFIHTFSNITLSAVGKLGVVDEATEKSLPESKYFFGGGSYSNRAYGFRQLGVILSSTEYSINGAHTFANLSLEANFPVWDDVYGAVFTDNTMLTDESYDLGGDVITSVGLGVRYMTPIGPFKLDFAFNVNEPSDHGILFQIGQSF